MHTTNVLNVFTSRHIREEDLYFVWLRLVHKIKFYLHYSNAQSVSGLVDAKQSSTV